MVSRLISREDVRAVSKDFGISDKRGRQIGGRVALWVATYVETDQAHGGYAIEPGTYFCAEPHATRDGKEYGACQRTKHFRTEAERDEYIAKYFRDAAKRAAK